jgi:hypothetical protein
MESTNGLVPNLQSLLGSGVFNPPFYLRVQKEGKSCLIKIEITYLPILYLRVQKRGEDFFKFLQCFRGGNNFSTKVSLQIALQFHFVEGNICGWFPNTGSLSSKGKSEHFLFLHLICEMIIKRFSAKRLKAK